MGREKKYVEELFINFFFTKIALLDTKYYLCLNIPGTRQVIVLSGKNRLPSS